jgi:hypothetical protein
MTLVQVAVHDAVNSITGKHGTYGAYGPAPAGHHRRPLPSPPRTPC